MESTIIKGFLNISHYVSFSAQSLFGLVYDLVGLGGLFSMKKWNILALIGVTIT